MTLHHTRARVVATAAAVLAALTVLSGPAGAASGFRAAQACWEPEAGFEMLFDGTAESLAGWKQAGPGSFTLQADCSLKTSGGLGMLWYAGEEFASYTLRLEWKIDKLVDNAGVFVGFPDGGDDTHNVAIRNGYEVQIDQLGRSDGEPEHITGAIYDIQGPNRDTRFEVTRPADWNLYEITVDNPKITVRLNGVVVNEFTSTDPNRDLASGHIGLQNHGQPDTAYFRNVQIRRIAPGSGGGQPPGAVVGDLSKLRNNVGIAQLPTSNANFDGVGYSYSALALQAAGVTPGSTVAVDGFSYTWPTTNSGGSDNVVARGQIIPMAVPAGATHLGLLAVADHGPSTGTFLLSYDDTDADGAPVTKTVEHTLTFSDWTLNGGGATPSAGNVEAIETVTRVLQSAAPDGTRAYVYSVAVPLDPTMTLRSIKLPLAYAGQIHIFDLAVR